jgi:hypothetical protein
MQARLVLVVETADAAAATPFAENRHAIVLFYGLGRDERAVVPKARSRHPRRIIRWTDGP